MSSPADAPAGLDSATAFGGSTVEPSAHRPRWRHRLSRAGRWLLIILVVAYGLVWWFSLRIEQRPVWPPPPNAVVAADSSLATAGYLDGDSPSLDDLGIPLAQSSLRDPEFFLDGTTFFPAMLADIQQATTSVHMQMFGFMSGDVGNEFADAFIERAIAGVEVRLIVDNYGSRVDGDSEALFTRMREAGVEIVSNNAFPLDRDGLVGERSVDWRHDELGQVDHRKTMVIDGRSGWIGGGGLEDHFRDGSFTDVFLRFEGDAVQHLQLVFLTSFATFGGPVSTDPAVLATYFPAPTHPGTVPVWITQNLTDGYLAATQASREVIRSATTRLDVMNPYFTDPGVIEDIIAAAERGVKVRLVVSQGSNVSQAQQALQYSYPELLDAGVEIWEHPGTMHAKVTIADDQLVVGTVNYDAWGLYRNLEIAALVQDQAVADEAVAALIEPSIAKSEVATADFAWYETAQHWIWARLSYFI